MGETAEYLRSRGITPHLVDGSEIGDAPDLPACAVHVWNWFQALHQGRMRGMDLCPLGWGDIQAWAALTGTTLRTWEINLLRSIDACWIKVFSAKPSEVTK